MCISVSVAPNARMPSWLRQHVDQVLNKQVGGPPCSVTVAAPKLELQQRPHSLLRPSKSSRARPPAWPSGCTHSNRRGLPCKGWTALPVCACAAAAHARTWLRLAPACRAQQAAAHAGQAQPSLQCTWCMQVASGAASQPKGLRGILRQLENYASEVEQEAVRLARWVFCACVWGAPVALALPACAHTGGTSCIQGQLALVASQRGIMLRLPSQHAHTQVAPNVLLWPTSSHLFWIDPSKGCALAGTQV